MERTIIQGIKRLRVLTPYDYDNMDELVQDLSNALEETSYCRISPSRVKKGRSWKRRSKSTGSLITLGSSLPKSSAVSEDSESSLDDRIKFRMDITANGSQPQSDSDDILPARQQQLTAWRHCAANMVESDSVNENFHPSRQHRRKRKFKRMAVDPQPVENSELPAANVPCSLQKTKRVKSLRTLKNKAKLSKACDVDIENICGAAFIEEPLGFCGKRKRSMRERSVECANFDERQDFRMSGCLMVSADGSSSWSNQNPFMEFEDACLSKTHMEASSSSLSSSESDGGILTNDEGREADDEQSDFFHEPGPTCGIPSWWEDGHLHSEGIRDKLDSKFETILAGSFRFMSESAKQEYQLKVNRLQARAGREIRAGRRRLGKTRPAFSIMSSVNENVSKFMQDPLQNEYTAQTICVDPVIAKTSVGDIKRRRRTPPVGPVIQGFIGESAEPIPESNVGNRMLRNMGWEPGTGLGALGQGIQSPLLVYVRAKHRGLGCGPGPHLPPQSSETPPPPPPPPPPSPQPVTAVSSDDPLCSQLSGIPAQFINIVNTPEYSGSGDSTTV